MCCFELQEKFQYFIFSFNFLMRCDSRLEGLDEIWFSYTENFLYIVVWNFKICSFQLHHARLCIYSTCTSHHITRYLIDYCLPLAHTRYRCKRRKVMNHISKVICLLKISLNLFVPALRVYRREYQPVVRKSGKL